MRDGTALKATAKRLGKWRVCDDRRHREEAYIKTCSSSSDYGQRVHTQAGEKASHELPSSDEQSFRTTQPVTDWISERLYAFYIPLNCIFVLCATERLYVSMAVFPLICKSAAAAAAAPPRQRECYFTLAGVPPPTPVEWIERW
jgi:hypothetical protein